MKNIGFCPLCVANKKTIAIDPGITYADLDQLASRFAKSFHLKGLRKGDCIAAIAHPHPTTLALLFGAWRLGLAVCLIPTKTPEITLQNILSTLKPQFVVREFDFLVHDSLEINELDLELLGLLLFTSGSSGEPKCAAFKLKQLFASASAVTSALLAKPKNRWLLSIPLHHVGGLGVILRALTTEGTLVFEDKTLPYTDRITHAAADFASLVPTQLYRLLEQPSFALPTHLLIGGAPLPQSLYERAMMRGWRLSLTYALTEMSSTVLLSSTPIWKHSLPFLGTPLPHSKMKLSGENEVLVKGDSLFEGYGIPPTRLGEWFNTKDLGHYDPLCGFAIVGRMDSRFISGGEKIQPEEIETLLLSHKDVAAALVVPFPDPEFGFRPAAYVQSSLSPEHLTAYLMEFLPKYKIPIAFIPFPKDTPFKPNRTVLTQKMISFLSR